MIVKIIPAALMLFIVASYILAQQDESTTQPECIDDGLLLYDGKIFEFAMVSDLDLKSRDPEKFLWHSIMRRGQLHTRVTGDKTYYKVQWGRSLTLHSETAKKNRSMELSELVYFKGRLLAMCDHTGLIFKISSPNPPEGQNPKVFQRWAIADGNGEQVKPCKIEWATVKDDVLWVGSIGKEWNDMHGNVLHHDAEWVKLIDLQGRVRNINWHNVYAALKFAANVSDGYLWHEAIHFCPRNRKWYILPRKRSFTTPYHPTVDETMGTNILLTASENFRDISVQTVGKLHPDRGFTAFRKVPGTDDHFLALKVREVGDEAGTWLTVFDSQGNMLLDQGDPNVDEDGFIYVDDIKFEGLEFV